MSARTLTYKLMVLTPVIFFAGIGVHARTYVDPFQPPEQTPSQQAAILAYVDVMRQTEPVLSQNLKEAPARELRMVADTWIVGAKHGVLKPLEPVAIDDSPGEGVKGQIFGAKTLLVGRLLTLANNESDAGQWDAAADDAMRAMRVAQVLKYSCFESVHSCANEQRRALDTLQEIAPNLAPGRLEQLKRDLREVRNEQTQLNVIASLARRQLVEDMIRRGDEPLAIQVGKEFMTARRAIEDNPDLATFRRVYRRTVLASSDDNAPSLLSVARLAYSTQSDLCTALDQVLHTLKEPTSA